MRMTMGLTLWRTARRINRLKGAGTLIPPGYLPPPDPRVSGALRHRAVAVRDQLGGFDAARNSAEHVDDLRDELLLVNGANGFDLPQGILNFFFCHSFAGHFNA